MIDSWTMNKVAGAVLGTCLVGMGIGIVAQGIYEPGAPTKAGYALPEPKETAAAGGEAKPEVVPIAVRMEHADPKKGEGDAKVCGACHNFAEGAGAKVGPDLWDVVDRPKGKAEGFDYSAGMKAKGGDWSYADLDQFLTKPSAYVSGTKMGYPGQDDPEKRADIIAYLRTLAKDPKPLPKVTEADKKVASADAKGGESKGAAGGDAAFIKLVADADPKKGQSAGQVCTACHNVTKGGGVLVGPPLWDVVDRDKGSVAGFDYSKGLKDKGGKWTIADLDAWLTKPAAYIPGTKMGYPGEADEKKRAALIAWLRSLSDSPKPLPKTAAAEKPVQTADAKAGDVKSDAGNGPGEAAGEAVFLKMIGESDTKKGQSAAQVCSACHNFKKGAGSLIGPALWDVVNRKKGSVTGFDYSAGLKAKGGEWTFDDLNAWLTNPQKYIPGTKMGYAGEPSQKRRAEIIAFLRTLSDHPVAVPNEKVGAKKSDAASPGEAKNMSVGAKPDDARPPAPPSNAVEQQQKSDAGEKPTPPATHDKADPAQKTEAPAAKPEQKTEVAPAKPEQDAMASDTSGTAPEPYQAADPAYPTPVAAEPTIAKSADAAPSLLPAGDKGEGNAAGPEPYAAATPGDSK